MPILKEQTISLVRTLVIYVLGMLTGIQIALYLFDYYTNGVADRTSLWVGIIISIISVMFIIFSFREKAKE